MRLLVETDDDQGGEGSEDSEEAWYRHELVGLRALSVSGEELGEVTDLEPGVAQDRLVVTTPEGDDVAVPFVEVLVPAIDPEAGTVTVAPSPEADAAPEYVNSTPRPRQSEECSVKNPPSTISDRAWPPRV